MTGAAPAPLKEADDGEAALRFGLAAAFTAYVLWGGMPLFLKLLSSVSAVEILIHRILWSAPFAAIILSARRQWPEVRAALASRRVVTMLGLAAAAISVNWLTYVWAVNHERVLQASLGYYINPLMYVAAGVFILGEELRRLQIISVALASLGVLVLAVGGGVFPWVSFVLAIAFTAYGYIRKTTSVGALPGLFIEVLLLSPIALVILIAMARSANAGFFGGDTQISALLILAGPVTVVPLVMFALAARRLTLTTLGLIQYLGPTLQFFIGLAFGEAFTVYHAVCFSMIWIALGIFSVDAYRTGRAARALLARSPGAGRTVA